MNSRMTIVGDETGTPFVENEVFTFAGIHFRGEVDEVDVKWSELQATMGLNWKARKYESEHYVALVEFILNNELIPFGGSILPDASLMGMLREIRTKFAQSERVHGLKRYRPRDMVWIHNVLPMIGDLTVQSLNQHGRIESIHIWCDQFNLGDEEENLLKILTQQFFANTGQFPAFIRTLSDSPDSVGAFCRKLLDLYSVEQDVQLDFVGKGKLVAVADAVASLFSKLQKGDSRATAAGRILQEHIGNRTSLTSDGTDSFKQAAQSILDQLILEEQAEEQTKV